MYHIPRILISAGASGHGKTLLTLALLSALRQMGKEVASFKCGPDYIDPMFHEQVLGKKSINLDSFFVGEEELKARLAEHAKGADIAVIEGVMGYYDGLAGISPRASAYHVAKLTQSPTILLVDAKGSSLSLLAYIRGFVEYKKESHIKGVIFNRISPMLYPRIKALVEEELQIPVFGYMQENPDFVLKSRHLGLILPEEVRDLQKKIDLAGRQARKTIEIDGLLALAEASKELTVKKEGLYAPTKKKSIRIGVAKDSAFCFFYEDNLSFLEKAGAKLIYFSPLRDKVLPKDIDGLLLPGGYPELYARQLSENGAMRESLRRAILGGLPCIAECGGFLYLHEIMEDKEGQAYPMAGVISGRAYYKGKLSRFGYIHLTGKEVFKRRVGEIPAHEFHYYESENCGEDMWAKKPLSDRGWRCCHCGGNLFAAFAHLYFYGNPKVAEGFYDACIEFQEKKRKVYGEPV